MTDEIVGGIVGGVVSAIIIGIGAFVWRITRLIRTYDLRFVKEPKAWPPAPAHSQTYDKHAVTNGGDDVQLYVAVQAQEGATASPLDLRCVTRQWFPRGWRLWRPFVFWWWDNVAVDVMKVLKVKDVDAGVYTHQGEDDKVGGFRINYYERSRPLVRGDYLWFEVHLKAQYGWKGHLEFCAPTPDGRRGYCRRRLVIIPVEALVGPSGHFDPPTSSGPGQPGRPRAGR